MATKYLRRGSNWSRMRTFGMARLPELDWSFRGKRGIEHALSSMASYQRRQRAGRRHRCWTHRFSRGALLTLEQGRHECCGGSETQWENPCAEGLNAHTSGFQGLPITSHQCFGGSYPTIVTAQQDVQKSIALTTLRMHSNALPGTKQGLNWCLRLDAWSNRASIELPRCDRLRSQR